VSQKNRWKCHLSIKEKGTVTKAKSLFAGALEIGRGRGWDNNNQGQGFPFPLEKKNIHHFHLISLSDLTSHSRPLVKFFF